jgi:hypothetical protein
MRCGLLDATYPGRVTYETKNAGDMLVRAGAVVFIIGALGTLATVAPLLLGSDPLPTAAYLVSMLMGVGFALALGGLLRTALAQRAQADQAVRAGQAASER